MVFLEGLRDLLCYKNILLFGTSARVVCGENVLVEDL